MHVMGKVTCQLTKTGFILPVNNPQRPPFAPKNPLMPVNKPSKQSRLKNIQKARIRKAQIDQESKQGAISLPFDHMTG